MLDFIYEYLPIVIVVAIIGAFTVAFLLAWAALKKSSDKADDRERKLSDRELIARLLHYAKPHWKSFIGVFFIMIFSVVYDVVSPLLMGHVQDLIKGEFELSELFTLVGVYASILLVSLICTYLQAMILQRVGQKILYQVHLLIEQLLYQQLLLY